MKLYAVDTGGDRIVRKENPLISDQDFEDLRTAWDVAKSNYDVEVTTARGLIGEPARGWPTCASRNKRWRIPPSARRATSTTSRATICRCAHRRSQSIRRRPEPVRPLRRPRGRSISASGQMKRYFIASRMASEGELLQAVSPMFRLVNDDPLKLKASVPERYFSELKIGQKVVVTISAYAKPFDGTVSRINPQVDVANRTFPIGVLIDNKDHLLPAGDFAYGMIETCKEEVLVIPATAIASFAGHNKVFVIQNGKVAEHDIDLGERLKGLGDIDLCEVKKLNRGDVIATSGTSRLANGVAPYSRRC